MSMNPIQSQLQRNIRLTVLSGAAAVMVFNLTNPFLALFVTRLGGSNVHIGLLSALPGLAGVLALIPGGAFVDRFTYKKKVHCLLTGASRFFYLCLALVPFLPPLWQPTIFVVFIGLMRLPGSVSEISWQSFFADYVPEAHRGYALAQKQRISTFGGMAVTSLAGWILYRFPQTDLQRVQFYQVFFVLAFLIAGIEIYANYRIVEPRDEENEKDSAALNQTPLKERFRLLFNSFSDTPQAKRFLIFAGCSLIFHFGWQMGWPLFGIYQIKNLGAGENWIAAISVIAGATSALSYKFWAKFGEKHGNDFTLTLTGVGMAVTPALYAASGTLWMLAGLNAIVGFSTAGFILTLMNITLIEAPKFQRTLYIACYSTVINVSAFISPNVGVYLVDNFGIHRALLAVSFFRFLGVIAFFVRYKHHSREEMAQVAAQKLATEETERMAEEEQKHRPA